MTDGVNMIALTKDGERFVFLYDDNSPGELLRTFGQYAADPELNFSWYDAAVLSQRVRAAAAAMNEAAGDESAPDGTLPFPGSIDDRDDDGRNDSGQSQRRAA